MPRPAPAAGSSRGLAINSIFSCSTVAIFQFAAYILSAENISASNDIPRGGLRVGNNPLRSPCVSVAIKSAFVYLMRPTCLINIETGTLYTQNKRFTI